MRPRLWLLAPVGALCAGDVGPTPAGQPPAYWAGDYGAAVEANPVAYPLLARSPWLFAGLGAGWLAAVSAAAVVCRHPLAGWAAMAAAAGHAVGGAGWLARAGPWGVVAAGVYIAVAARASAWCWRRHHGGVVPPAAPDPA